MDTPNKFQIEGLGSESLLNTEIKINFGSLLSNHLKECVWLSVMLWSSSGPDVLLLASELIDPQLQIACFGFDLGNNGPFGLVPDHLVEDLDLQTFEG